MTPNVPQKPDFVFDLAYVKIPVFYVEDWPYEMDILGFYDNDKREIRINAELKDTDRGVEVLGHEVVHAIDAMMSLGLKHRQVYALGVGMVGFLKAMQRPAPRAVPLV